MVGGVTGKEACMDRRRRRRKGSEKWSHGAAASITRNLDFFFIHFIDFTDFLRLLQRAVVDLEVTRKEEASERLLLPRARRQQTRNFSTRCFIKLSFIKLSSFIAGSDAPCRLKGEVANQQSDLLAKVLPVLFLLRTHGHPCCAAGCGPCLLRRSWRVIR